MGGTEHSPAIVHESTHERHGDRPGMPSPEHQHHAMGSPASRSQLVVMTAISFVIFGAGFLVAGILGDLTMHH